MSVLCLSTFKKADSAGERELVVFNAKKAQTHRFIYTLIAEKKVMKGELCSRNFNTDLIGFKDGILTKMEKIQNTIIFYLELPEKMPICPTCSNT